jgi:hypothetical protein
MYYVIDFDGNTRTRKDYKTLKAAIKAAEKAFDKNVYVENDYHNLRPIDPASLAASALGRSRAGRPAAVAASRENGKKGGRPGKEK